MSPQVEVKNGINFDTKISFLILKASSEINVMVLRINNNAYMSASERVRSYLLEMGQSNPS